MIILLLLPLALTGIVFFVVLVVLSLSGRVSNPGSYRKSNSSDDSLKKGEYGEHLIYSILVRLVGEHKILTNAYILKQDTTTTEIDLVLINQTGIYVFESKNYSGWIFGNEKDQCWTQSLLGGQKERFHNPIRQNRSHIAALRSVLPEVDEKLYFSYIVFSERCEIMKMTVTSQNVKVLKRNHLEQVLLQDMNSRPRVLPLEFVAAAYDRLLPYTQVDPAVKAQHIQSMQSWQSPSQFTTD